MAEPGSSEIGTDQIKDTVNPTSQHAPSFLNRLREVTSRFFKRNVAVPVQTTNLSEEVQDILAHEEDVSSPEVQEILKPSQMVYFHATANANLESITTKGLYGKGDVATLGRSIGYSLFLEYRNRFAREYMGKTPLGNEVREKTPEDVALTVWIDPNQHLERIPDERGFSKYMKISTSDEEAAPQEFLETHGSKPYLPFGDQTQKRFSSDNLSAVIPLTKPVREAILKGMVLAHAGKMSADQIEQELVTVLEQSNQDKPGSVILNRDTTLKALAHNLVSAFERELVEDIVLPSEQESKENPTIDHRRYQESSYYGVPVRALFRAMTYRKNINEPELAEKLDGAITRIRQQILSEEVNPEGFDQFLENSMQKLQSGEKIPAYLDLIDVNRLWAYYSGGPTLQAAVDVMKEKELF